MAILLLKKLLCHSMLLNLAGSSNANDKKILWKFINRFHKDIKPQRYYFRSTY